MAVAVLDRFSGDCNPEDWIYRAEQYFTFLGFSKEHWLPLPSLYLDGEALEWFRWMFRNKQFFDWNHFKEKLALRFRKRTYAKSTVVDSQITSILDLLQKMVDKCSFMSQPILVKDAGISAATVVSGEIAAPLAEENSSPVDNVGSRPELSDTSIAELSSHVDNMVDEMSTRVFTNEVEKTSSAFSFAADLEDIQSPEAFNELFHSGCPEIVVEVQSETPIKKLDDESPGPDCSEAQLFDECFPIETPKRYITATSLDHGSSEQKIAFETTKDLSLDNKILNVEESIPPSYMPSDEMLLVVEHVKSIDEFNAHIILCQFSFNPNVNSSIVSIRGNAMKLCVWDPGIRLDSMALTGYTDTVDVDPLQLLGSTDKFCFIPYANSTSQVWDPGQHLCDTADSQKEGSQSSRAGLHSTTNSLTLISTADWKPFANCLALPRETINMVMLTKGQTKVVEQSYLRHLLQSLGQRDITLCFLLLTSTYYELFEPYMHTFFELTPEASNKDEVSLQAIELWSKVLKLDGLQCCKTNFRFRWINHLRLGLKTHMFSPKEEKLIATLHVICEQRRAQLATQLTETSQDQLVGFFSPAPTIPIHNFALLEDEYVMLGSSCTTGDKVGVVMCEKIIYFFGERGALCCSESFCPVRWLAIIFDRNVSWFDIASVQMGCLIWVISFMVWQYKTEITPKHIRDSFAIINQLMICYGGSLIIQLFSLFLMRDSPRWLTKATHWKACTTFLQQLRRNTAIILPTFTSVKEFIPILEILSKAKMFDFLKRMYACSLIFGVGLVLHQIGHVKAAAYCALIFVLVPETYISFLSILEGYVNNITCTGVVSAYGTTDFFLISNWTCQPVAFAPVEVSIATSHLSLSFVVEFLYSNLEDKVLIEDESIVVNQVQPNVNTKVTQLVIGLKRAIGPTTSNWARLNWDPG